MNTRAYLMQLRTIDFDILNVQSEADSWRELAMKLHHEPSDIRVDTSPMPDKMENLVIKAADSATEADREKEVLIYLKATIEKQIKSIEDKECVFMLWGYYHDRLSVEYLAKKLNYSYKQGKRVKQRGERLFEEKYGKTY